MKKLFICLANSKKYTQRCIAGIELVKSSRQDYRYEIARQNDNPIWIRPVSGSRHGEVESHLVDHISLLDIVEVHVTSACPDSYQTENIWLDDSHPLKIVEQIDKQPPLMDKLLMVDYPELFGNTLKFVDIDEINQINRSLVFIKPANAHVYETIRSTRQPQIRANFYYNDIFYSLPVTDIDFMAKFRQNPDMLRACPHIYFTVSLGIEFEARHYKLVAGIVYF
jgi:hypothetical protein